MAKRYDNTPWTAIAEAPSGVLPTPPCGFVRDTYSIDGVKTHYRFVPECGNYEVPEYVPISPDVP